MRHAVCQKESGPKVEPFKVLAQAQAKRIPGKSDLANAFRYGLSRWDSFCMILDNGGVAIDSNLVERKMKPVALERNDFLFAGSGAGGETPAAAMTIIETVKDNGLDPQACLNDIFSRIHDHKINRIDELPPRNWKRADAPKAEAA